MVKRILLLCSYIAVMLPRIGCMDYSNHADTCLGYDYKNYHYVNCSCPCRRYPVLMDRHTCIKCGHFHEMRQVSIDY